MKVTNVVFKATSDLKDKTILGFADITFDDALVVKGVRVLTGKYGPFLSFPSKKGKDKAYYDIVYPLQKNFRNEITDAVLKEGNLSTAPKKRVPSQEEKDFWAE